MRGDKRSLIAGVIIVAIITAATAGALLFTSSRGLTFFIDFGNAAGLKVGDSVYLKGLDIGEVLDIGFINDEIIRVKVRITDEFKDRLKTESTFIIVNDKFIFGKKCIRAYIIDSNSLLVQSDMVLAGVDSYLELIAKIGAKEGKKIWDALDEWIDNTQEN